MVQKSLLLISFFGLLSCSKNDKGQIQPTVGKITESVYASGVIKSENQYTVYPTVNGVLQKIYVTAGQTVEKNQLLFHIESDKAALNTENARVAYQLSRESSAFIHDRIAEMELKVQAAKEKLDMDESVYKRNKKVKQYNIFSEVDYERAESNYKISKSNYEAALKQLSQLKLQLKNEQERNLVNLKISEKSQGDFAVKSAFSGELFDVLVKEGTLVNPQTPLAIIGKKDAYLLELNVDENDMVRVRLGQVMEVIMDSYKREVFEAIVDKIYPIMDVRSRTFKIEAHFVKVPPKLYPNLTAEANIIIETRDNVLTIPKKYLVEDQYVLMSGGEKRKVKIGLNDYQNVEILDGLTSEETIILPK